MRGTKAFVVHIPNKYNEKYTTESGLEIYGDHRWMAKDLANTIVDVVQIPFGYDGPIKIGTKVFVDPTLVMQGIHKEGVIDSPYLIDREEALYKAPEDLIIAFSNDNQETWKCLNNNVLLTKVERKKDAKVNGIIQVGELNDRNSEMVVFMSNDELVEDGVNVGDTLYVDDRLMISVKFNGKELIWLNVRDLFALV